MKQRYIITISSLFVLGLLFISKSQLWVQGNTYVDKQAMMKTTKADCLTEWPQLNLNDSERERLSELGVAEMSKAGEHPSKESMDLILTSLRQAALAGSPKAQKKFGFFVVSYWVTDELFWPSEQAIAIDALAMLRIYALTESQTKQEDSDDLLRGLALTPPTFDEELPFEFPEEWLNKSVKIAKRWQGCHHMLSKRASN